MEDALVLETSAVRRAGSTPVSATMIVDFSYVRHWTHKLDEAVNKAQRLHPDAVLTLVTSTKGEFGGLVYRRLFKRNTRSWMVYQPYDNMRLAIINEDSTIEMLPNNWCFPTIYDEDWDGTITDTDRIVKEFW
jgi:hypothetical protein